MKRFFLAAAIAAAASLASAAPEITTYYAPNSQLIPAAQHLISSGTATIHIAANTLTDARLIGSLATARSAGRTVVAVLNVSGGTARSLAAQSLHAAGVTVYLSDMPDLLANHVLTVDGGTCAVGNYYWSPAAVQVGAYLSIVADLAITGSQDSRFAALVSGGTLLTASPHEKADPPPPLLQCYFSPNGGAQDKLCSLIANSQHSIRALVYTATNIAIFQALIDAHRRGVNVQVVADPYCAHLSGSRIPFLYAAGVPVRLDAAVKIMHEKVLICDDTTLAFGSYNFSEPAEHGNAENMVVTTDAAAIEAFVGDWFVRYRESAAYTGPPPPDAGPWQTVLPPPTPPGATLERSSSSTQQPTWTPDTRGTE